jgi:hypothetical protein
MDLFILSAFGLSVPIGYNGDFGVFWPLFGANISMLMQGLYEFHASFSI